MTHRNLIIIIILIGVSIFSVFFFLQNKKDTLPGDGGSITDMYSVTITEATFENSVHVLSGVVLVPTPCHQVTVTDVLVAESYPEQVRISLSVGSASEVCAQVITEKPFTVSFNASKEAEITFLVNGQGVNLEYISGSDNVTPILSESDSLEGGGEDSVPAIVQ